MLLSSQAVAADLSGHLGIEQRGFLDRGVTSSRRAISSIIADPEFVVRTTDGAGALIVHPFYRWDAEDENRTHFDLRELAFEWRKQDFDFRVGVRKVFWGVAESQHVVDVVNQTDLVEALDLEEKLGQPMLNMNWRPSFAAFELYVLPYFREREFKEVDTRLGPPLPVAGARYESSRKREHTDLATRIQFAPIEALEAAVSHFRGTNREPLLAPGSRGGKSVLTPYYSIVNQTGIELQWIQNSLALKSEAFYRSERGEDSIRAVYGAEYTLYQIGASRTDVGLILEHNTDSRRDRALTTFQNDLFVGTRLNFNNEASSELIAGMFYDVDHASVIGKLEWNHRLSETITIAVDAYAFHGAKAREPLYTNRKDDMIELRMHFHL